MKGLVSPLPPNPIRLYYMVPQSSEAPFSLLPRGKPRALLVFSRRVVVHYSTPVINVPYTQI